MHYHVEDHYKIVYHELNDIWEVYDLEADPEEKHSIVCLAFLLYDYFGRYMPKLFAHGGYSIKEIVNILP